MPGCRCAFHQGALCALCRSTMQAQAARCPLSRAALRFSLAPRLAAALTIAARLCIPILAAVHSPSIVGAHPARTLPSATCRPPLTTSPSPRSKFSPSRQIHRRTVAVRAAPTSPRQSRATYRPAWAAGRVQWRVSCSATDATCPSTAAILARATSPGLPRATRTAASTTIACRARQAPQASYKCVS